MLPGEKLTKSLWQYFRLRLNEKNNKWRETKRIHEQCSD